MKIKIMTKKEFLALAETQYDKLESLKKVTSFYDYEKGFEEIWIEYGRLALECGISKKGIDRRKKKKSRVDSEI